MGVLKLQPLRQTFNMSEKVNLFTFFNFNSENLIN